jgi:type IV secretion system protein VirD4
MIDIEHDRYGSARWSERSELANAGLFSPQGMQIGYYDNRTLSVETDAPMITIAGSGSGKMRDLLSMAVARNAARRNFILDPRGEIASVTMAFFASARAHVYCWNPVGMVGLPQHRINPLDILKWQSPNFHADCKFIAESLIPSSGSANGQYFELRAREWLENIIKALVERDRHVSFVSLYSAINMIEGDHVGWADLLEFMLGSTLDSVRRTASEMLLKQQKSSEEFGTIIGEAYAHLNFLDDPMLQASLEAPEVSSKDVCASPYPTSIFINVPIEYVSLWAPLLRTMFTVQVLYKSRTPHAEPVHMIVDEAGQLGRFEALLRAFTFGRGAGVRSWALFQDVGQIIRHYGAPTLQSFLGSAAMRQFFGIRDYQTAQMVSEMLGTMTLEYDDSLAQSEAKKRRAHAAMSVLNGTDLFQAGFELKHQALAQAHRSKQARPLMSPDEILALPEDKQVIFISGKNLPPILGDKRPYFTRKEKAFIGRFLPNPYHPPQDSVVIPRLIGTRRARVITESVPYPFCALPQYQSGQWSYVEGFKPR